MLTAVFLVITVILLIVKKTDKTKQEQRPGLWKPRAVSYHLFLFRVQRGKAFFEVGDDIVDVLGADRKPDGVWSDYRYDFIKITSIMH